MENNDFDENFDEESVFTVNYHKIANNKDMPAMTKLLAYRIITDGYITPGDFFKSISEDDLDILLEIADEPNDHPNAECALLMAEMLATSEGLDQGNIDEMMNRTNQFLIMAVMESLYRKGMIKLYHENMSFGEDMGDKIVAERV